MTFDTETSDTIAAGPDEPEAQAREVVDAMRAAEPVSPETERTILGAGRAHARVAAAVAEPERPK